VELGACRGIAIAIGIEIVCTLAIDPMLLTNLGASVAETVEQSHDSSISIAIPISILVAPNVPLRLGIPC